MHGTLTTAYPPHENWLRDLTPPDFSGKEKPFESFQDSDSDSEITLKAPTQSPETSDTGAAFHTPPKTHPLWTEGSVGSALQIIKGGRPTFIPRRLKRAYSLSSIFHPDHIVRERHPVLQERRDSLQSDSLDCPSYIVDLHFRSLVKLRQESHIPPPNWRGPPKQQCSHLPPPGLTYTHSSPSTGDRFLQTSIYFSPS